MEFNRVKFQQGRGAERLNPDYGGSISEDWVLVNTKSLLHSYNMLRLLVNNNNYCSLNS
jgi:hypothetical protein